MKNITQIMDMIDWHMSPDVQLDGIQLAKKIDTIFPFIQPLTPKYNKNVWENCAIIISERKDDELKPFLVELLEWLQDMNWPGAFRIMERLKNYTDKKSMSRALNICLSKATNIGDDIWKGNLSVFFEKY